MNSFTNRSLSKTLAVVAAAASLLGAVNVSRAALINVTVDEFGVLLHNPVGIANKAEYTALVGNGNSPSDNYDFLAIEVGRYNDFHPDLPTPVAPLDSPTPEFNYVNQGDLGGQVTPYTTLADWDYVVFHWGAGNAGQQGWYQALYLGGDSVTLALPVVAGNTVGGFSSARYFNQHVVVDDHNHNVPDSGSTVISLGLALLAIGLMARKTKVG